MGDQIQDFRFFINLGFDPNDEWLIYDDAWRPFFRWMTENISDDNILSDVELREYSEIEKSGNVLHGTLLKGALDDLEESYPGILSITNDNIKKFEQQLEELTATEETYDKLITDMKITNYKIDKEISELEKSKSEITFLEQKMKQDCCDNAKLLQELQEKNQQLVVEMHQLFITPQSPPLFISQMPLEQYINKCELFVKYLEIFLQQNFYFKNLNFESDVENNGEKIEISLQKIKKRLFEGEHKLALSKMENEALKNIIKNLENNIGKPLNISLKHINDMKSKNEIMKMQIDAGLLELDLMYKELADQECEIILFENTKTKFERATKRLDNINKIGKIVSDTLSNAEMLWILMNLDIYKIKNKFNLKDDFGTGMVSCGKRINAMKNIMKMSTLQVDNIFKKQIKDIYDRNLISEKIEKNLSTTNIFETYFNLLKMIPSCLKNISLQKQNRKIINSLNSSRYTEREIIQHLMDGPVNKPHLYDSKILERSYKVKKEMEKIKEILNCLKNDYYQNYVEPSKSDKLWQNSHLLWVWFLTEPRKVSAAIQDVMNAAAKSSTFKSLSGIKCQK